MNDPSYALEKITATRDTLAEGAGPIKERLTDAYVSQGMNLPAIAGGDDDPDLADDIKQLHADMTKTAAVADEGTIEATVNAMSEDEAQDMARRITALASRIETIYWVTMRSARR